MTTPLYRYARLSRQRSFFELVRKRLAESQERCNTGLLRVMLSSWKAVTFC